jgi:hypothetical protein
MLATQWLGKKRYRALGSHPVYLALCRGLTFGWFAFTLFWFWADWKTIERYRSSLGLGGLFAVWITVILSAAIVLSVWEGLRTWLLSLHWHQTPLVESRYLRTMWTTALLAVTAVLIMLLNSPAPRIVYKNF